MVHFLLNGILTSGLKEMDTIRNRLEHAIIYGKSKKKWKFRNQ